MGVKSYLDFFAGSLNILEQIQLNYLNNTRFKPTNNDENSSYLSARIDFRFGHFDDKGIHEMSKKKCVEPRLAKGERMMDVSGSNYRTITSNRPNIDSPLTSPKRGDGQHKIKKFFGKKAYAYNDALTTAYMMLAEKASSQRKDILFITVTLDDKTNLKLRRQDADDSKEPMIRTVSRWFQQYEYITDAIVVLEECSDSFVNDGSKVRRWLHLHIVTMLKDSDLKNVQTVLLREKSMQVQVKDNWLDVRLYNADDEWEEE